MPHNPIWRRYARLFGPDSRADVQDELQFHLEAKVDDLIAQGLSPDAARREAERRFGNLRAIEDTGARMGQAGERRERRRNYRDELRQDLRYALRTLRKDRAFTLIAVSILALAIAANTAVFSLVDAIVLRPLPFPDAQHLAWLSAGRGLSPEKRAAAGLSEITYTVAAFEEFQRHNRSFESVTSYNPYYGNSEYTLTGRGEPQSVSGVMVASNFFQTLGVQPALGRLFLPEECRHNGRPAVLVSNAFWRRHFAADPSIVGRSITLGGQFVPNGKQSFTVVGILPPSFDFGSVFSPGLRMDLFVPAVMDDIRDWGNTLALVGRLKPGVSLAQAQAEADVLFPQLRAAHRDWYTDYASTITGLKDHVSGKLRHSLVLLWTAVGFILLIVCVNLSNLQLARGAARGKEFALRSALGAGRARLFRQLLTENLVLSGAGAVIGLALAYGLIFYLSRQESVALPLLGRITLDGTALAWTLIVTVASALIAGLVPGLRVSASGVQDALKDGGHGLTPGRRHERLRGLLVTSEVALACVLLIGAGLLVRSFLRVLDIDLGFEPSHAAVLKIDYDDGDDINRRAAILQEILSRVSAMPGVETAGVADMLPLGRNRSWVLRAKGRQYARDEDTSALARIVTPHYLDAMGIRLRSGRDFTWADSSKSQGVVILNQAAARRHWPGEDPVGRIALIGRRECAVIGVASDVRGTTLENSAAPEMYFTAAQAPPEGAELVVRTKLPPAALAPDILKTLRALNPSQPASELRPLRNIVDRAVSPRRFFVLLAASFAVIGLVLASLGIYGVISYSVTQQTQEIGVRLALGASPARVRLGVICKAMRLALSGVALGAAASLLVTRWLAALLYGTQPSDPPTFAGIILLLTAVSLLAGYLPARRASRIDPLAALRTS
jgi:predicted permease